MTLSEGLLYRPQPRDRSAIRAARSPKEGRFRRCYARRRFSSQGFMTEFSQLGLSPTTLQAVADTGYTTATPIQAAAIPVALAGREFIVSNRDRTFYFANNNARHFAFNAEERFLPVYEFADVDNKKIVHLDSFAETFLVKCTLGQTISRYMVLVVSEQKLMIMRPYQVYAVKAIVDCIQQNRGNGYIWHTTGSGKTLTSFKASTLLKNNPDVEMLRLDHWKSPPPVRFALPLE